MVYIIQLTSFSRLVWHWCKTRLSCAWPWIRPCRKHKKLSGSSPYRIVRNREENFEIGNKSSKLGIKPLKFGRKLQNLEQNFKIGEKTSKFGSKRNFWNGTKLLELETKLQSWNKSLRLGTKLKNLACWCIISKPPRSAAWSGIDAKLDFPVHGSAHGENQKSYPCPTQTGSYVIGKTH